MRIAPLSPEQLREALDLDAPGTAAEGWRTLREDVRALAPPLDPEFQRKLHERLRAPREPAVASPRRLATLRNHCGAPQLLGGAAAVLCAIAITLLAVGTFAGGGGHSVEQPSRAATGTTGKAVMSPSVRGQNAPSTSAAAAASAAPSAAAAGTSEAGGPASGSSGGRVQEQSASLTLSAPASEVQPVADAVSRLAGSAGGYVVNSQVNVRREGSTGGEATLVLSIPSAHLTQALAALGRLAPVRAQSQSLQDITDSYESARRALADAVAERAALLRALAKATTQGEIESLRRRLALADGAIQRTKASLQAVSKRATNSRVEVAVLAAGQTRTGGLTLARGLHDAGTVLTAALAGLLIALAVLVPLGILGALLALGVARWRRLRREQALDSA